MVFPDDPPSRSQKPVNALDDLPVRKFRPRLVVGRIEKDDVERGGGGTRKPFFDRSGKDGKRVSKGFEVLAEGFTRERILLNKEGRLRTATKGFDPIGARAGKEVEYAGFRHKGTEGGEDGGADAVLCGTETGEIRDEKPPTAMGACRDTQKTSPSARMTRGLFFPITYGWLPPHTPSYASS